MLDETNHQLLLNAARQSIKARLNGSSVSLQAILNDELPEELNEERATFVTLKIDDQLRGCIGNLEASSSLIDSVIRNACSAAFNDPRFSPLNEDELDIITISISVLTPSVSIGFEGEDDLLKQLRPNQDGLTIEKGHRHATFLPAVWEGLPQPNVFLQQLKAKAGISLDEEVEKAWRYETESFSE